MKKIVIAGISTDVGKTVASAACVKALSADYWKPVQCGDLATCDTTTVRSLIDDPSLICHPAAYSLPHPVSPHLAAALEGVVIEVDKFQLPKTKNTLIIECAGGLLVPFTDTSHQLDIYKKWDCDWILVSKHYLGSINHTLLSIEALKRRNIRLKAIIFNGNPHQPSERVIRYYAGDIIYLYLHQEKEITPEIINQCGEKWHQQLKTL